MAKYICERPFTLARGCHAGSQFAVNVVLGACSLELDYPSSLGMCIFVCMRVCVCQINSDLLFALLLSQLGHTAQHFLACPCSAAMQLCVCECEPPESTGLCSFRRVAGLKS